MSNSQKPHSERDYQQTLKLSFNDVDDTLSTNGFLVGLVGRKISMEIETTNTADDTELYTFSENGAQLYQYTVIYTSSSRQILMSAERTA